MKKNMEIRNKKILDIGCGDGYLLEKMRKESKYLHGVEPNDKRRKLCKERILDLVAFESILDMDPKQKFDLIVMTDVIEHLLDPRGMLSFAKRMLNPNGFLYVDIPDVMGKGFISDLFFPHMHHFSNNNFDFFLRKSGFKIITHDNYDMTTTFLRMFLCSAGTKDLESTAKPAEGVMSGARRIETNVIKKLAGLDRFFNAALLKLEEAFLGRKDAALVVYPCGLQTQMLLQKYFSKLPENVFLIDRNATLQNKIISGVSVKPPEFLSSLFENDVYMIFSSADMSTNKVLVEYVKSNYSEKFEYDYLF